MKMIRLSHFSKLFRRKKKKLRVGTAKRATSPPSDFDDMSEPNMKLSRALLVVLLLHVVAVAGIIAFNAIKSRHASVPSPAVISASAASPKPASSSARHEDAKPSHSALFKEKKPKVADPATLPEGAKYYIVAKGDSPVTIAKKFKVPYDELLAANRIDDPHKLQVGQKLIIPAKKPKKG